MRESLFLLRTLVQIPKVVRANQKNQANKHSQVFFILNLESSLVNLSDFIIQLLKCVHVERTYEVHFSELGLRNDSVSLIQHFLQVGFPLQ